MKQSLKNRVSTIRDKIDSLIDDLNDRRFELEERDDPEGKWQDEMDEIDNLVEALETMSCDLEEYEY